MGGPPLVIYAIATDWPQPQFAATGQIAYALQAATALATALATIHAIAHLTGP